VWLLIALPMSAVIGGMITLYLAVTTSDGLVVDDYYKHGKAINRVLARDRAAAARRLEARFQVDVAHNRMTLMLQAEDAVLPETLQFSFLHPTRKGHDQRVLLAVAGSLARATGNGGVAPVREYAGATDRANRPDPGVRGKLLILLWRYQTVSWRCLDCSFFHSLLSRQVVLKSRNVNYTKLITIVMDRK
jgi:hypothetical protein